MEDVITEKGDSVFELWKEILHGERIGLKVDSEDIDYLVIMTIDADNLWVDADREFLGAKKYTVVGRLNQTIAGEDTWNFIDLLKIFSSVFSEESVTEFRDLLMGLAENLNEDNGEGYEIDVEIDREDYVVEEPAIVIDPIAIYW